MRKRNEASRSHASTGQRLGTRLSSVPAREEPKSVPTSKEQGKSSAKVPKGVVEAPPKTNAEVSETVKTSKKNAEVSQRVKTSKTKNAISAQVGVQIASTTASPVGPLSPETSQLEREISLAPSSTETCKSTQTIEAEMTEPSLLVLENPGTETLPVSLVSRTLELGIEVPDLEASKTMMDIPHEVVKDNACPVVELKNTSETRREFFDSPGMEREKVASVLDSAIVGGQEILPPKELPCLSLQPPIAVASCPLPCDAGEHVPLSVRSADLPGCVQEVHILQNDATCEFNLEPISAAEKNDKNGPLLQQATEISMGEGGQTLNHPLFGERDKDVIKDLTEAPSFPHDGNTFKNNMVSFVEGETVLIVENLGLTSQILVKVEGSLYGIDDTTEVQKVADKQEKTQSMLAKENDLVGRSIRKKFGRKFFEGKVVEYDSELHWYKVVYEDGDKEELDIKEVQRLLSLAEQEEDERSAKRKHRHSSSIPNSVKRSTDKAKTRLMQKDGDQASTDDNSQQHERVKLRGLKRRVVIDTSNDVNTDSFDSNFQTSTGSDNASDDNSEPIVQKRLKKVQTESLKELRPESLDSEIQSPLGGGAKLIGRKTKKDFGGQYYIGEIVSYDDRVKYYKVRYEDGDEEELEWGELESTLLWQDGASHAHAIGTPHEGINRNSHGRLKEHSRRSSTSKSKEGAIILYEGGRKNGDVPSTRRWRKKTRTASVSVVMKGMDDWNAASTTAMAAAPPRPLAAVRFASASDADVFEYFGWGEAVNFDQSRCPDLRATRLLPTSSPVVHLATGRHHLVALTAAGQVWVWRCKHGNIHTRCNEWEHVALLDNRNIILVDIAGPDVDRTSAGYQAEQEDQVPDPFYLAAICSNGEDIILQGSQPHESVHTYQYDDEPQHPSLRDAVLQLNPGFIENVGNIVQVSVGMVEAADESPFVGYITDTDCVYIRSATREYMEEVNLLSGYTGKPVKIQCGRVYHAILLTDDGRAWTWGQGYYPSSNIVSAGLASKWNSPFSVCQPAVGTLVGRKVVDVGCYGEDFIALTSDGEVHQWTHARPNPAAGVYNVPATPVYGQGPIITNGDELKHVAIGAGVCSGISESGKVHTWRTSMKGGFVGTVGLEREVATPLGRDEGYTDTAVVALGTRVATKAMCVAGSLLIVVKRRYRGRRGGKRKFELLLTDKSVED